MTAQVLFFYIFFEKDPHLNALEMFSSKVKIRIRLSKEVVLEKIQRKSLELYAFAKRNYEKERPIDWSKTKCNICKFKL